MNSNFQDAPLTTEPNSRKLADPRIKDASQGYSIYKNLQRDDSEAAIKRADVDYQIDGGLPYSEQVMIDAGRGDETNANFMEARVEDDAAQTPYVEMTTVSRILWDCRTSFGDSTEQAKYSRIISEEFTDTVRAWDDFSYFRIRLAQQFTRHGVAFLYFEDEIDWRWKAEGLAAFKIPRNIQARASAIPYATCESTYTVDELYAFIRDDNEELSKELGRWNVEAVKQALIDAKPDNWPDNTNYQWEDFMKRIRENDLAWGNSCPEIKIYHLWGREFDGSISHYIGLQTGPVKNESNDIGKGWLYENRSRFKSLRKCIIPFFYGIGTHGTVHTVRGNGELNYTPIAISNRARCGFIDAVQASCSILIETDGPNEAESLSYIRRGPLMIMMGKGKVNATALPDVASRALPLLRDMQSMRQNLTPGSFQSRAITEDGSQERTKYEIQAQQQKGGTVQSSQLTMFAEPLSHAGREMFDRMMADALDDSDPGGAEAFDFRKRVIKRGVPMEALESVFSVEWVRSIGYGSPETRQYSSEQIYSMSGGFDAMGQREAKLQKIAALPGVDWRTAESFVGPEEPRLTWDDTAAELENNDFRVGQHLPVFNNQNHWIHCQRHAGLVNETEKAFNEGKIDGAALVPIYSVTIENMLDHSEYLSKDPMKEKEAAYVRKFVQNKEGTLEQQENKLIAEQQRAQEEQQQQGGGEGEPGPEQMAAAGEEQRRMQAHQQEMEIKAAEFQNRQREFEQRMAQQDADAQQLRDQRDLELAAKLAEKRAKSLSKAS